MGWNRVASVEYAGRVGTGSVVAPGLVLTAYHLVQPSAAADGATCWVRLLDEGAQGVPARAEVAWRRGDVALLRCRPREVGEGFAPVRWGELACMRPGVAPECVAVGLPRAAVRHGSGVTYRAPHTTVGRINVVDNVARTYSLQVAGEPPQDAGAASPWQGMSGAGVFCEDVLVGVVTDEPKRWNHGRLEALPVRRLLDDRGLCDLLEQATGMRPRLEPADLTDLLEGAPQPAVAASYLLAARSEVTDFVGCDTEMATLLEWCAGDRAVDVAVVQGAGGVGKTRLGAELARRLSERRPEAERTPQGAEVPWSAGFLSEFLEARPETYTPLRHLVRPALVVIDYAESRTTQVEQVLQALAAHRAPGRRVRVLLLARSSRGWWQRLQMRHPALTSGQLVQLTPAALYRNLSQDEAPEMAQLSFQRRLATLRRGGVPDDWDPDEALARLREPVVEEVGGTLRVMPQADHALTIHMDALARVLGCGALLEEDFAAAEVLIEHEMKYCLRGARAEGLDVDPELLRVLIAVQSMAGARTDSEAAHVVTLAWQFYYREFASPPPAPETVIKLRRLLADLYPALSGDGFGTLGPDTLTTELLEKINMESGEEFLEHVLLSPGLCERQRRRCLTLLARGADTHDELAQSAAGVIATHPDTLHEIAAAVAEELSADDCARWLARIENAAVESAWPEIAPQRSLPKTPSDPPPSQGDAAAAGTDPEPGRLPTGTAHETAQAQVPEPKSRELALPLPHSRSTSPATPGSGPLPRSDRAGMQGYFEQHELQKYFLFAAVPISMVTLVVLLWLYGI